MVVVHELGFTDAFRAGGANQQERRYLDYTINGRPLRTIVSAGDHIGVFGWLPRESETAFARALLLLERSELPSGRVPLYICPECADLGCQALSARVVETADHYVWSDLAWEASYDQGPATDLLAAGPFSFDKAAYRAALDRFAR